MFLDFIKISISCALALSVAACASHGLPKIERDSNKTARLVVEGKPFVILGGELLNSSGSTASDMQKHWAYRRTASLSNGCVRPSVRNTP